jgi:pimeloyl-ACP methyl ester carboxylesterase
MRVSVGDIELYVHERGEGRPLVTVHGGPGFDGSVWFPGIEPLADEGWRVLAPDLRANGRSGAGDPDTWTVPQMADDVEALIQSLELADPVVAGWSFGSFVVQSHMVRHGTASAYVLMGTVAEPAALERVQDRLASFEPQHLREQVTLSWERESTVETPEDCRSLWHDQIPFQVLDPEGPWVEYFMKHDEVVFRPEVLRHFATGGTYGMEDWREELREFGKPVLVLSGEGDRTTDPASAHELASLLPAGEEVVIRGAAHMFLYERQDETLAALRSFLARV